MMVGVSDSLLTFFPRLMPVRQLELLAAMKAQQHISDAPPLVGIVQTDSGITYRALGAIDDAGLSYLLPKLAALLHLPIRDVWTLWFLIILLFSLAVGIFGMMRILHSPVAKTLFLAKITVLSLLIVMIGDVYQLAPCLAIACVPFVLLFISAPPDAAKFRRGLTTLFAAGIVFGWAHLIRSHSATGLLLFIGILLLFALQVSWAKRMLLLAALFIGFILPLLYMQTVFEARDTFLKSQAGYRSVSRQHPFWHSIYIGLGYLSNEYGLAYKDEVAAKKVYETAPDAEYCSPEYEDALKAAVFDLVRYDPVFIALTLLAKSGVILIYFCLTANVGLLSAIRSPKPWSVELAFALALGFNALFGLLVMPRLSYLLGFLAFSMLYGVVSLDYALRQRHLQEGALLSP